MGNSFERHPVRVKGMTGGGQEEGHCDPGSGQVVSDRTSAPPVESTSEIRESWLSPAVARAIESDIIPRLMLAHGAARKTGLSAPPNQAAGAFAPEFIAAFAQMVLDQDVESILARIEMLRSRGAGIESIHLDLLAPSARHLGELWNQDLCDFTDVTIGLWRLRQVLHALGTSAPEDMTHSTPGRRVLLAPVPGEQHSFGLIMVAEFFSRANWTVSFTPESTVGELVSAVRSEWYSVVGLSLARDDHLKALRETIRSIRKGSRNRSLHVLVGGNTFLGRPDLAGMVGADACADDARQAVEIASRFEASSEPGRPLAG